MNYLKVENLSKNYGENQALKEINFNINSGEKIAVLGCNGAGKSTLLNIITGLKTASAGCVSILEGSPKDLNTKKELSFLPQELNFPSFLKVKDILKIGEAHFSQKHDLELLESLDLDKLLNRYCHALSGGEQRKLGIVMSLLGERKLVILDEPTANIDVVAKEEIHKILKGFLKDKAFLFSSHEMVEVEKLADRVIVLNKGEIIAEGLVSSIKKQFSSMRVSFKADLESIDFKTSTRYEKNKDRFIVYGEKSDLIVRELVEKKIDFTDLKIEETSLEEVFLKLWSMSI